MNSLQIRPYRHGDAVALWTVFFTAIHQTAAADYSLEQLNAWAPATPDMAKWEKRIRGIQPFVAEWNGEVAGYADLQLSGLIDHFFVSPTAGRRGVGSALMAEIHRSAQQRKLSVLFSEVSLTARPFFEKWGFRVETEQTVWIGTVALENFRMTKSLSEST